MKDVSTRIAENSRRAYARFAGFLYLFVLAADIAGAVIASTVAGNGTFVQTSQNIIASEQLYRIGLCFALVGSLSTILLAIGLYAALKPVDENLAMTALLFRAAEAAIGGMGIILAFAVLRMHLEASHAGAFNGNQLGTLADFNSGGTEVAAIFFSLGSTVFFYLFLKSNYVPRILAAWGLFASVLYAAVWFQSLILPKYSATVGYGSVPILIAELSTGLWLLIRGINIPPRN